MTELDPGVSVCFEVKVDTADLGWFNSCEGLGIEIVMETREEGGNNGFVWQLPTRIKYPNIKLSRPLGPDTMKVAEWFASMTTGVKLQTATIAATTMDREIVAQWSLRGVVPVRWTGPSFNIDSPKVAVETIEIAHQGFLTA